MRVLAFWSGSLIGVGLCFFLAAAKVIDIALNTDLHIYLEKDRFEPLDSEALYIRANR
jgi:hypothetical protein